MSDDIRIHGATTKKELNEDLWSGERLKSNVREALLKIAEKFYSYTGTDLEIKDIQLVGSNASYNWTSTSDIDLHLIMDFSEFSNGERQQEVLRKKFLSKKRIFNDEYDIKIFGHEVEMYVEDINDYNASDGIFSVQRNLWVRKPKHIDPDVNRNDVKRRVRYFKNIIDRLEDVERTVDKFERAMRIKDEIVNMRQSSLESEGNFSVGNVVFKTLRESGYISTLFDHIAEAYSELLSINESLENDKEFNLLVEGIKPNQHAVLTDLEMELVDEYEYAGYTLALVKLPMHFSRPLGTKFQLGLQKKGTEFTSFTDHFRKTSSDKIQKNVFYKMLSKITEWIGIYGSISIGSANDKKIERYKNLLQKQGFNTTEKGSHLGRVLIVK